MGRFWKLQNTVFIDKKLVIFLSIIFLSWTVPSFSSSNDVLVRVGDEKITESDLMDIYRQLPPSYRKKISKNEVLELMVDQLLLYKEALRLGIDKDPEVKREILSCKKRILAQALLRRLLNNSKVSVSKKEIENYYWNNLEKFKRDGKPIPLNKVYNKIKLLLLKKKQKEIYESYIMKLRKKYGVKFK